MKTLKIIALIMITASLTACADKKEEKKSPTIQQAPAQKKEDDKTTISISGDSVGVTTRKGDKVEVSKDGGTVENNDVKVKVKKKKQ